MSSLYGKNVVVFGAGGQLGAHLVLLLLKLGARVIAIGRTPEPLGVLRLEVTERFPGTVIFSTRVCDISSCLEMLRCMEDLEAFHVKFDAAINLVGRCPPKGLAAEVGTSLTDMQAHQLDANLEMYVRGQLLFQQVMLDVLKPQGCLVTVGTAMNRLLGVLPHQLMAGHYAASKQAQVTMARWLRGDPNVRSKRVLSHVLEVGAVDTDFHHGAPEGLRPPALVSKQSVAEAIVRAIQSRWIVDRQVVPFAQRIGAMISWIREYLGFWFK